MNKVIETYIDKAIERNDLKMAIAFKWVYNTQNNEDIDNVNILQQIYYKDK